MTVLVFVVYVCMSSIACHMCAWLQLSEKEFTRGLRNVIMYVCMLYALFVNHAIGIIPKMFIEHESIWGKVHM